MSLETCFVDLSVAVLVGGSLVHQSVFTGRWLSVVEIHSGNFILTNVLSVNNLAKLTDY